MASLEVAVIGCGSIGAVHLSRWSEVSGARVVAVCDSDAGIANRLATEFGAEAHTDWRSLLQLPGVTVCDICTPPIDHAPIAIAALDAGLHVLCEKPMAGTSTEATAMVDHAHRSGKLLMPAFCHRFHPPVVFARELIDCDDLGRVVMFRCRFSGLFPGVEDRWFSDPAISGGGVLLDTAVHAIDLFRFLVGEVASATGRIARVNPGVQVEDSAAFVLEGENGAIGVVECSWATPGGRNVLELYGTAGACVVDYDANQVRFKTADMPVWETREVFGPDRFQGEIAHFAECVRGIDRLSVTGSDGLRANEIIEQVLSGQKPL